MPLETKKVLWTVLSVVIVLVVGSGIALALAYPRGSSAKAPATVAAVAAPRSSSPDEYIRAVEPAPVPTATLPAAAPGSDVIIVYGDKPAASTLPGTMPPSDGSAQATAGTEAVAQKPYSPAPSTATKPLAKPAATPVAASPSAKPTAKPAAKPSAPRPVAEYWIQAAAFTSRSRADDLQRELAQKGLSTLITVKDIDGATWFRVRIGPYTTESEAKVWLDKVRALAGCAEAYVSKQTVSRSS